MATPFEVAEIFIDSNRIKRPPGSIGEVWNDEGDVSQLRHHRIAPIDRTLEDVVPRMGMNVGENTKSSRPAVLPQCGVTRRMKRDGTILVGVWIKIVITDKRRHPIAGTVLAAQKKRSAFAAPPAPVAQLENQPSPEPDGDRDWSFSQTRGQGSLQS